MIEDLHRGRMYCVGSSSPVHHRLVRDWQRLRYEPPALHHASGWRIVTGSLSDLDQIVSLTLPGRPDADRERILRDLVERARGDELAARVLLQRLVPDLLQVHRRRRWRHGAEVDFGELLATGWIVIRTYNTARRPVRLVNALVSDIEYREYRAAFRRLGHDDPSDPARFERLAEASWTDPIIELSGLATDPTADLSADERDLLGRLVSGRRPIDIARDLEVTPRTVRNRRDRIALKLRQVAAA